jgi:hypothetical protein
MPNPVVEHIPLLAAHEGIWEGQYTHIAPDRTVQEQILFRILVEFPADGAAAYRQTSHYWWADGRTQELMYEGRYRDHALWRTTLVREHRVSRDVGRFAGLAGSVPELPWCKDDAADCVVVPPR